VISVGGGRPALGIKIAALAALMLLAYPASMPWWRKLDDMAREAHLAAWYWGASIGGGLCVLSLLLLKGSGSSFFMGAALVMLVQVVSYVLCWLGWWALRRLRVA
jgi:hypothetical protein